MRVKNILILLVVLLALGGVYFAFSRPKPAPPSQPRVYVWSVNADDIERIEISLPHEGKSQAFVKIVEGDKFPWHFDDPQRSSVNTTRWGGGIPLLLSGPGANRIITDYATDQQLAEFGLAQPKLEAVITLANKDVIKIDVGDATPDGNNYYVRAPGSNAVATVDYTWYEVVERLVTEPPYAPASTS